VLSAPRSPWQRAYIERVIGTIRRECLDQVIVFDERSLRFICVRSVTTITEPAHIWHCKRTRLILGQCNHPNLDRSFPFWRLGGFHHRYERRAAKVVLASGANYAILQF
jgi:transposase InsO family protein